MIEWVGRKTIAGYTYLAALATLVAQAFLDFVLPTRQGRRASLLVLIRQILFTGVDALPVTTVIALMVGIIIITQAGTQLPKLGAGGLVGTIIVVTVIRELGPLLTAFIVVGRSGRLLQQNWATCRSRVKWSRSGSWGFRPAGSSSCLAWSGWCSP